MDGRSPRFVVGAGSVALVALATSVLLGWATGVTVITSVLPGLATMKPATAVCFLASGVSLGLLALPRSTASLPQRLLAVGVAVLGGLTVLEYRTNWDGGFDGLFLWQIDGDGPYPARMSEMTAVAFLTAGLALTLAPLERAWRWTQALAVLLAAISLTAVVGYWYGVDALYAVDPFSSMALHTALGFAVMAASIVSTSSERGLVALARKDSVGGVTFRRYLLAAVAGPLLVGWLQVLGVRVGHIEHEFGTAVAAVGSALLLAALVWGYSWWLDVAETQRAKLEAQVHQAQKMESIGRLAGGVAHDFNNVLSIILTTASLLEREVQRESARRDLVTIQEACRKATTLTKQLLALGRKQVMQAQVINLNDLVRDNESLVRTLVPASISHTIRAAPDLGNVLIDPGKMEQVLLNLVVNAVDAMPNGGALTIETRNIALDEPYAEHHVEVEPGAYVVLLVSDTGIGMDSTTMESMFEPFFTTKPPGKGTGLGLATAHGIVRQSKGHMWAYSEVGRGTTFKIYLPRVDRAISPARTAPARLQDQPEATEFILVVDDDSSLARQVAKILERSGYTVYSTESAADALRFAEAHDGSIDLVLTDLTMPGMDGRALVGRLVESRPDVRVLYMSGYTDDSLDLEDPGEFLEKPFTPTELLGGIRAILDV